MTRDLLSSPTYVPNSYEYPQSNNNSKIIVIIQTSTKIFSPRKKREKERERAHLVPSID